jgi:hypothetical protein
VLLNILRMVDEWSEIEKKIFSPYLVFKKTPQGRGRESLSPQDYLKEKLTSEQELVYNLVDGTRTVQDLIDRSLLGKFNTSEIVMNLLEMGMLEVVGLQTPRLLKKVTMMNFRQTLTYACYGLFLVAMFSVAVYVKPSFLDLLLDSKIEAPGIEAPADLIHRTQVQRIKDALEVYYFEKGSYPKGLEDLTAVGLLQKDDLFYRKGNPYKYELKEGKYFLKR